MNEIMLFLTRECRKVLHVKRISLGQGSCCDSSEQYKWSYM